MKTDKLLTKAEAAALIGVSEARISQLISAGVLNAERTKSPVGNAITVRLHESVVLDYKAMREQRVSAQAA